MIKYGVTVWYPSGIGFTFVGIILSSFVSDFLRSCFDLSTRVHTCRYTFGYWRLASMVTLENAHHVSPASIQRLLINKAQAVSPWVLCIEGSLAPRPSHDLT